MLRQLRSHPVLTVAVTGMWAGAAFVLLRAATGIGGSSLSAITDTWDYTAVEWLAVGVCAARAWRRRGDRLTWGLITAALACWSIGDLLWTVWLDNLANPPFPSVADIFYLAMYPMLYVALMRLMRSRLRHAGAAQWLDGGVVGLTVAAVAAVVVFGRVIGVPEHDLSAQIVNAAYPVSDFVLLIFVGLACSLTNWRPGRGWLLLGGAVAAMAAADIAYLYAAAEGNFVSSDWINGGYLVSIALFALAAWTPIHRRAADVVEETHTILLTLFAAAGALAILVIAAFTHLTPLAVLLAAAALVLASARAGLTYMENVRMLRRSAREATTDALTGLGNRRRLMLDLEEAVAHADRGTPSTLVFFDLNGFKRYNDSFGHAAGDALLARLGSTLATEVGSAGRVYRLGGDEFCLLARGRLDADAQLIRICRRALSERGSGFSVDTSLGRAVIPDDAPSASALLQLADERMYAEKARTVRAQARDVLMQVLTERTPGLLEHSREVTDLVRAVAVDLGIGGEAIDEALRAAELHDIGKLAIPDEILNKPGPLNDAEWTFMRQHPQIGERILAAAPALAPVARLVRASHERWDGAGYPDGLATTDIPLGARIVAVCDAYEAMISDRVYRLGRSRSEAIAELERCAGTQFDPDVVASLVRHLTERAAPGGPELDSPPCPPARSSSPAARPVSVTPPPSS